MSEPILISKESFQEAWIDVAKELSTSRWEIQNLMVTIKDPTILDTELHDKFNNFADTNGILSPKAVAYTIFPHKLYQNCGGARKLYDMYNKPRGLYARIKKPHEWGTYFRRMTHYEIEANVENQLDNIIKAINTRTNVRKAAYTIVIQRPGGETIRPLGGPCLNYLAVQLSTNPNTVGLLAVYRNHDFSSKAYGNYWGLCNLIKFIAKEINFNPGSLTCISSHAYIQESVKRFRRFIESLS